MHHFKIVMTERQKQIRADIERFVAHMARVHAVKQDEIWRELYIRSLEEVTLNQ